MAYHISQQIKADREFHEAYGKALSQWAIIEQRMFYWFWHITALPESMSRPVFYSARNFAGRADMLESTFPASDLSKDVKKFLKAATKKARQFASFRNQLAHGETMFDDRPGSPTLHTTILIDGKLNDGQTHAVVTTATLEIATNNFRELSRLIMDGLMHAEGTAPDWMQSLDKCLEQVRLLPNLANCPPHNQTQHTIRSTPLQLKP